MTCSSERYSRKLRQERLDEQAGGRKEAQRLEDDIINERVRKNIEEHGA